LNVKGVDLNIDIRVDGKTA